MAGAPSKSTPQKAAATPRVRSDAKLSDAEKEVIARLRSGELDISESGGEEEQERHAFTLSPSQIAAVESGRGRKPVDPLYLADVQEMIEKPGEYAGYRITDEAPIELIQSKIRRAARHAGLTTKDYSVYVREKDGFVAFMVHQT